MALSRRRRWGLAGTVALVVAAVAAVVGGGGLAPREGGVVYAGPGDEADAHNLVFRFDRATAQHKTALDTWEIVVTGSVRNPQSTSAGLIGGSHGSLWGYYDGAASALQPASTVLGRYAADEDYVLRRVVPPDGEWLDLRVTFAAAAFDRAQFAVIVTPMEFTDDSLLSLYGTPSWNQDSYADLTAVVLPVEVLPETEY
ncbi:MAG: hypothetical protein LBR33_05240 [Propionibacteriaceae bacterium]|nr:hypothetical protein [Propionibacteriaceae bacterium]